MIYKTINIYNSDGTVKFTAPIGDSSLRHRELQGEDYVRICFTGSLLLHFVLGDYIIWNGLRFEITELQQPKRNGAVNSYELQFNAFYKSFENRIFKFMPQYGAFIASWPYCSTIDWFAERLIDNIQQLTRFSTWTAKNNIKIHYADLEEGDEAKTISFDNDNILSAIEKIAEAWECEWWFDGEVLHLGTCETGEEIALKEGEQYLSLSSSSSEGTYATRIYGYGSTRNLTSAYRKQLFFTAPGGTDITDSTKPLKAEYFRPSDFPGGSLYQLQTEQSISRHVSVFQPRTEAHQFVDGVPLAEVTGGGEYKVALTDDIMYVKLICDDGRPVTKYGIKLEVFSQYKSATGETKLMDLGTLYNGVNDKIIYNDGESFSCYESYFFLPDTEQYSDAEITSTTTQTSEYENKPTVPQTTTTTVEEGDGYKITDAISYSLSSKSKQNDYGEWVTIYVLTKTTVRTRYTIKEGAVTHKIGLRITVSTTVDDDNKTAYGLHIGFNAGTGYLYRKNTVGKIRADIVRDSGEEITGSVDIATGVVSSPVEFEKGETYTISNIIRSAVPLKYFYSEYDQFMVNGMYERRLLLPESTSGFVDTEDGLTEAQIVETVATFDDIYPRRESEAVKIETREVTDKEENPDGTYTPTKAKVYRLYAAEQDFSTDYIIAGETLGLQMTSGKLAGFEFEVRFIPRDSDGEQCFEIVRQEIEGVMYPHEDFAPEVGDKFVLYNFDIEYVDARYISDAEEELLVATRKYANECKIDPNTYDATVRLKVMEAFCNDNKDNKATNADFIYQLGQRVMLCSSAFFKSGSRASRVMGYEFKLAKPYDGARVTIGEQPKSTRLSQLENKVDGLEGIVSGRSQSGNINVSDTTQSINLIKSDGSETPSDNSAYSSLRSEQEFLSKTKDDKTPNCLEVGKDLVVKGNTTSSNIEAQTKAQTKDLVVTGKASLQDATASSLQSLDYVSGDEYEGGKGFGLTEQDGISKMEVDELTVRKKATFTELEIRKLSSVGGNLVLSAAASTIKGVVDYNDGSFRIYLNTDDGTTTTTNLWAVGDIVRCQTFNLDESQNATNKNYYGVVKSLGEDGVGAYIVMSQQLVTGSAGTPEKGDAIVQMGNIGDNSRQSVIVLETTGSKAPCIMEYSGVSDTDLSSHLVTQISPKGNVFDADMLRLKTGTGDSAMFEMGSDGKIRLKGEAISLEGYVSLNGQTSIDASGTFHAEDADIEKAVIHQSEISGTLMYQFKRVYYDTDAWVNESDAVIENTEPDDNGEVRITMNKDMFLSFSDDSIMERVTIPFGSGNIGKTIMIVSQKPQNWSDNTDTSPYTYITCNPNGATAYSPFEGIIDPKANEIYSMRIRHGLIELLGIPDTDNPKYNKWLVRSVPSDFKHDYSES